MAATDNGRTQGSKPLNRAFGPVQSFEIRDIHPWLEELVRLKKMHIVDSASLVFNICQDQQICS